MSTARAISYQIERLVLDSAQLAPERKLPSERQLAARFGVSRAVIREALHELQGRGVIETQHGRGSFVSGFLPGQDTDSKLYQLFADHPGTLFDLLEVREQLEGQAAFLAAQRADQRDRHRITVAYEAMVSADPLANADLDHGFHRAIAEASHNPALIHILNSIKSLMLMTVQASVSNMSPRPDFRSEIDRYHRRIYNTILRGQADAAARVARAHVRHVIESLQRLEAEGQELVR